MSLRLCPGDSVSSPVNMSTGSGSGSDTPRPPKSVVGKDFFLYKILSSILWSIVLQCLYVSCVLLLMNIDVFHPFVWIKNTVFMVIRPGTWFYLIPLGVVSLAQGVLMSKDYVLGVPCYPSRLSFLCGLFTSHNVLMALLNVIFGAMVVSYYSTLLSQEPGFLTLKCQTMEGQCLSSDSFFLILNGMWIGLYVFWQQCSLDARVLNFPMIQQLKYPQVKNRLLQLTGRSLREALLPTFYCVIFYAWYGSSLSEQVAGILGLSVENTQRDSLTGFLFLRFWLLLRALLCGGVIILIAHTMKFLFEVHLTEHSVFPISVIIKTNGMITLPEALASPLPILKHLGFLDLLLLSERDNSRRAELFSLSIPGGHPHNWNAVSGESLRFLQSFTNNLNAILSDMNRGIIPSTSSPQTTEARRPIPPFRANESLRMRNMTLFVEQRDSCNRITNPSQDTRQSAPNSPAFLDFIKKQVCFGLDWIRRKPGINHFFGEMTEARIRHLLITHGVGAGCAAQALSVLAAVSLTQDKYGIVQKDLVAILTALVQLRSSLERLPMQSHKRVLRGEAREERLKRSLLASVKRGLFAVSAAFGDLLTELPLSPEVMQQLSGFIHYRES